MVHHELETAFTMDTSSIKFGEGATREVGFEAARLGARRWLRIHVWQSSNLWTWLWSR